MSTCHVDCVRTVQSDPYQPLGNSVGVGVKKLITDVHI